MSAKPRVTRFQIKWYVKSSSSSDRFSWLFLTRDVAPPGQNQTALGAKASAAVPSANDLDVSEDVEMSGSSTNTLNGIPVS